MKYLPLIFVLTTAATPALAADGFSYADLNAAARTAKPDSNLAAARERLAQTETLRAAFVLDPVRAWKAVSPAETQVLFTAFGGQRPLGDEAVQWFMRGASSNVSGGVAADDMTGLYNPLADAWLVMRWQRIGGALHITDAVFVPGTWVRSGGDMSSWTESSMSYADALAQGSASARTGFSELNAAAFFAMVKPIAPVAREQAFASVMTWMGSLRPWSEDKARRAQWQDLHEALASGKTGGVVASLPPATRASLLPMGAIEHAGGQALLLVSPLAPQVVVTATYGPKGKPDVSLTNLANAQLAATATTDTGASQ